MKPRRFRPNKGKRPKKRTSIPEWTRQRESLLRNPLFVKKALKNLAKTEPGLIELFRTIPKQARISKGDQKCLLEQLKRYAIEGEMHRHGMTQIGPPDKIGIAIETKSKTILITIQKTNKGWQMLIKERVKE